MADFVARVLADYTKSQFNILTTDLTFDLADKSTVVTNVMKITKTVNGSAILHLNGEHLKLLSISLNETELDETQYQLENDGLLLTTSLSSFTLTIVTEINPLENTSLEGLFKSGNAFCTQCEAEGFRRISYYLDRPDVMAKFSTKVIADKKAYPYLLSNGNKVAEGDLPEGRHFVEWQDPFPKPCYLFALVAGDFDLLQDTFITSSDREVALEIFVDKGNLSKASHAMASLKHSMTWDEDTFGLEYDLDIYMIVAVDFFNMGAMENKGLNVFNSKYVLADETTATDTDYFNIEAVIAHEYFHNWTGNRVTCRDWFQLSLKEGLTVFRDQQFSADMNSAVVGRIQNVRVLRSLQFAEDAGPMAHAIRPEKVMEMNNFYTLTVYEKGAEVIRMLHTLLGKENFRKGMDLYFKRFDGMAVTCDDFIEAMADASNINLDHFKRWYSQAGTPLLKVKETFNKSTGQLTLTIEQHHEATKSQPLKKPLHIPINIELIVDKEGSQHQQLLELKEKQQTWTFEGFKEKPVVAFLAGFTAPVNVDYKQSDEELEAIILYAIDEFCRWDAGQKLLVTYIKRLLIEPDLILSEKILSIFSHVLTSDIDNNLKAEQLTLPTFDEIAATVTEVDPVKLVDAIEQLKRFLAIGLKADFTDTYHQCVTANFANDKVAIGQRALKNVCLSYLSMLEHSGELVKQHYDNSDNMTDTLAALSSSAKNNLVCYDQQMQIFEQKWQTTSLVMDKWFSISASLSNDDIYQRLNQLLKHPLFSLKNPNRARSLIGAFAVSNPKYFHCSSGRGYKFLAKQITLLNEINPQVASRLITPLIQFKSFDKARQQLIKNELEQLALLPTLSKDLKEKLDAALA
ncbi:MAG: aminopeptidase N [Alteromonadaceae bacterium]|jgi:aminopeptidase N